MKVDEYDSYQQNNNSKPAICIEKAVNKFKEVAYGTSIKSKGISKIQKLIISTKGRNVEAAQAFDKDSFYDVAPKIEVEE